MANEISRREMPREEHDRLHELLLKLCTPLPTDFEPWGERKNDEENWGPDCSAGCRHFLPLEWPLGADWGVCANTRSPRAGMLTFEHQGCREFEGDGRIDDDEIAEDEALDKEISRDVQRSGYREEDAVEIVRQHRRDKKSE